MSRPIFHLEKVVRALVCHAPLDLRLDAFAAEAMGPRQLRVRVAFGGICGSDLHYFQHGGFGTVRIREPLVLGHEVSGVVGALGSDASSFVNGHILYVDGGVTATL